MPQQINAVLVRLSISILANTRQDRAITEEVRQKHSLGHNAGKWLKYKLPPEALQPISEFAGEVRRWNYDHTLPWEEGHRLLTASARTSYDAQIQKYILEFGKYVEEFVAQYPQWIEQAKIMHKSTFVADDYPAVDEVARSFELTIEHLPVPNASHFDSTLRSLYGEALEEFIQQRVEIAMADTWQRLLAPVRALADKLLGPDTIFRDSLVENVREIVQLIPTLNLTDNGQISQAAQAIQQQLATLNPDTLREDKVLRKQAVAAAQGILARFGGVGQRKFAA